ncbi:MAG: TatD family hydrolase [Anaerosomatales bacterium]|nr:TatD family hydrolase [Anaerosomatales bacterium]
MSERPIDYAALALGSAAADAHAHLDMLDDPAQALANAALAGVGLVATVVDLSEDRRTFEELDAWRDEAAARLGAAGHDDAARAIPEVRVVAGVHPHNASMAADVERDLVDLAKSGAVAALGELGLDYHYEHSPREVQRQAFERHLGLAHEAGLPVIVHLRESHDDGHAMLRSIGVPKAGCVIHCFTEDAATAERFLALGCFISFAGVTTFKKAHEVRQAAAVVPIDRLLTETDCPFLAPEPFRGHPNEPALVTQVVRAVAAARGMEPEVVAQAAFANAARLFDARGAS